MDKEAVNSEDETQNFEYKKMKNTKSNIQDSSEGKILVHGKYLK